MPLLFSVGKLRHRKHEGTHTSACRALVAKNPGVPRADLKSRNPSGVLPLPEHPQTSCRAGKKWLRGGQGKPLHLAWTSLLSCFQ